ncbi:MAG: RNA polymerase sigma factor [Clostridia bacterium]|nr:RNA polymerase sigma factor [Oscillospiraceae bacterium]MBQ7033959.1 RNA polymerase sigma factor [Clostridia bacterium]
MTNELIKQCQSGNRDATETLVRQYTPVIYKLAFSMLGNEHDASDAVQETFIKILKSLSGFRGDSSFSTWIYRVTSNTCLDMLRKNGRHRAVSPDDEEVFLQIPDTAPTPEEAAVSGERRSMVRAAVSALPTDYKLVVTLCDLNGLSYAEAADILGCPQGTVKSRLSRARALLLKHLSANRELFDADLRQNKSKEAQR